MGKTAKAAQTSSFFKYKLSIRPSIRHAFALFVRRSIFTIDFDGFFRLAFRAITHEICVFARLGVEGKPPMIL